MTGKEVDEHPDSDAGTDCEGRSQVGKGRGIRDEWNKDCYPLRELVFSQIGLEGESQYELGCCKVQYACDPRTDIVFDESVAPVMPIPFLTVSPRPDIIEDVVREYTQKDRCSIGHRESPVCLDEPEGKSVSELEYCQPDDDSG